MPPDQHHFESTHGPLDTFRRTLRPLHDRIERTVDLMRPDVDMARYDRFLVRSHAFITSCERELDLMRAPPQLEIRARLKTAALEADLDARGLKPESIEFLPRPDVSTWPDALGYLYVIEGSTLGGQLLYRHLSTRLGLPDSATHFLRGYGSDTGRRWKGMLQVLTDSLMTGPQARAAITVTAAATFTYLEHVHALE